MKVIGTTIGILSLVALTLAAVLAMNTSPADAQERNLTESTVDLSYITSSHGGSTGGTFALAGLAAFHEGVVGAGAACMLVAVLFPTAFTAYSWWTSRD